MIHSYSKLKAFYQCPRMYYYYYYSKGYSKPPVKYGILRRLFRWITKVYKNMKQTKLSHSYSALSKYDKCPKQYYYLRVSKEAKDVGNVYSKAGERIHKALEERLLYPAKGLPEDLAEHEPMCKSVEKIVKNLEPRFRGMGCRATIMP